MIECGGWRRRRWSAVSILFPWVTVGRLGAKTRWGECAKGWSVDRRTLRVGTIGNGRSS